MRNCKVLGVKGHPARFPSAIPEFFIKLLTEPGDLVVDIFGGSNTTGKAAESLGRQWMTFELSQEYVANSVLRFVSAYDMNYYERLLAGEDVKIVSSMQLTLGL